MAANAPAKQSVLKSFPSSFWTANVMELFERAAYYGVMAVLGRYLTDKEGGGLGFSADNAGLLQSLVYAATYIIPILGGALADRYGYRRLLLFAFSLLSAGYFLTGTVTGYAAVLATLLLVAVGSGLFKPIISGTIARTTNEQNSGFGFGVYYWMINLGALLAPLVVIYLRGMSWSYVFFASSIYCALMLVPTLLAYKNPPMPESSKKLGDVLAGAVTVLSDARFMLMVVIYSFFWVLYFQNFGTVLWYLRDFVDPGPANALLASVGVPFQFDAEFVTMINAGTIVLLQVVISRLVSKTRPLPTMVAGILFGSLGFLCLAFSSTVWLLILGIAVFSIGEMTAHPKYYSYIGLVAPADKKAVYMGYAFLYGVIGSLIGANLGGELYTRWLTPVVGDTGAFAATRSFWLLFAALGGVAMFGLIVYNRFFAADTVRTRRLARTVMFVVYSLAAVTAVAFFATAGAAFSRGEQPWKTVIQASIMLAMGLFGLFANARYGGEKPAAGADEADPAQASG